MDVIPGGLISQQCPPSRIVGIGFGQHKAWLKRAKACEACVACVACVGKLAWDLPPTQCGQAKIRHDPGGLRLILQGQQQQASPAAK